MKPYPGTQAIRRALTVLKAFTDERPEWRLPELAEAVGLNRTTAYRALVALEREGLLTRLPERDAYRLGPELIVLGARALRSNDLRTVGQAELERLARAAEETATLEVMVDGGMLILAEVKGPGMMGTHVDVGTRWPVHATSTGKAMLAAWEQEDPAAVKRALSGTFPALTRHTITKVRALRRELERIRQAGFAVAAEELQLGYTAVGAVVRNHEPRAVAAVAVGGPNSRVTSERVPVLGALVVETAQRISRRLGAAP